MCSKCQETISNKYYSFEFLHFFHHFRNVVAKLTGHTLYNTCQLLRTSVSVAVTHFRIVAWLWETFIGIFIKFYYFRFFCFILRWDRYRCVWLRLIRGMIRIIKMLLSDAGHLLHLRIYWNRVGGFGIKMFLSEVKYLFYLQIYSTYIKRINIRWNYLENKTDTHRYWKILLWHG